MATVSPYATALKLARPLPGHIKSQLDQRRVAAYWTYWDIFRNVEEAFLAVMRNDAGDEMSRRLIPSARTIIEATNRYLARDPQITPLPLVTMPDGTTAAPDLETLGATKKLLDDFLAREEFFTKILSIKRWMLIRGDACFHLLADDTKLPGQRLRVVEIDPSTYFPIEDPLDAERILGAYLVSLVPNDDDEDVAMRQSYVIQENGTIFTKLDFFEPDGWDDRTAHGFDATDLKPVSVPSAYAASPLTTGFPLPPVITKIPIYHFRNNREGGLRWGVSELQGIETLLAGVHQTASDQDITITLTGIGVYVTTSGRPKRDDGTEDNWVLAPASVIELESTEDTFNRVQGVDSIQPLLDHSAYLEGKARETTGLSDVSVGRVDVQVAESGIALAIQMAPVLSKNEEKERELKSRLDQMFYDIVNMWLPAFEATPATGLGFTWTFGDPLPVDRAAVLKEVIDMVTAKLIPISFAQKILQEKLGYEIPADALAQVASEQTTLLDSVAPRLEEEAAGAPAEF